VTSPSPCPRTDRRSDLPVIPVPVQATVPVSGPPLESGGTRGRLGLGEGEVGSVNAGSSQRQITQIRPRLRTGILILYSYFVSSIGGREYTYYTYTAEELARSRSHIAVRRSVHYCFFLQCSAPGPDRFPRHSGVLQSSFTGARKSKERLVHRVTCTPDGRANRPFALPLRKV